jgi:UDP-glucose 4-epimerase
MIALVEAMRAHDVGWIVFSSTRAVYGTPQRLPIVESMALDPINPYGRSKRMAEKILRDACAVHRLCGIALRYFNAAGADPAGLCAGGQRRTVRRTGGLVLRLSEAAGGGLAGAEASGSAVVGQ